METKEILKQLRKENGYSAKEVAEGCDMSLGVYKKYESGERGVGTPALCKFADFYNVTTDYLLGREEHLLDFISLPDEELKNQIGDFVLKVYRTVPAVERNALLEDAKRLFEYCKNELAEQETKREDKAEPPPIKKLVRHEATLNELEEEQAAKAAADAKAKKNVV